MLDCLLIGLKRSIVHWIKTGYLDWIGGHDYTIEVEREEFEVSKCKRCGKYDFSWW